MSPTCNVCGEPIHSDESYEKDAFGIKHIRCNNGVARPRPEHMEDVCPKCRVQMSKCRCFYSALVQDEE